MQIESKEVLKELRQQIESLQTENLNLTEKLKQEELNPNTISNQEIRRQLDLFNKDSNHELIEQSLLLKCDKLD